MINLFRLYLMTLLVYQNKSNMTQFSQASCHVIAPVTEAYTTCKTNLESTGYLNAELSFYYNNATSMFEFILNTYQNYVMVNATISYSFIDPHYGSLPYNATTRFEKIDLVGNMSVAMDEAYNSKVKGCLSNPFFIFKDEEDVLACTKKTKGKSLTVPKNFSVVKLDDLTLSMHDMVYGYDSYTWVLGANCIFSYLTRDNPINDAVPEHNNFYDKSNNSLTKMFCDTDMATVCYK